MRAGNRTAGTLGRPVNADSQLMWGIDGDVDRGLNVHLGDLFLDECHVSAAEKFMGGIMHFQPSSDMGRRHSPIKAWGRVPGNHGTRQSKRLWHGIELQTGLFTLLAVSAAGASEHDFERLPVWLDSTPRPPQEQDWTAGIESHVGTSFV